ncbi:cilia- and flagella-associated protein 36-like, partial [Limulus polyphemus]|uniref:Cilia- and flagella-associated protein 36 n=1 Tax=Limulus polyphemus TaxID=6850 RepID=A0ABM1B493_LIMPO
MADEQLKWIFDSLIEFLKGPIWNIPIQTFLEHKSAVFEPGTENEDEYKKIHEEYKNLVDFMLGSHMEDLGISPEKFEQACGKADGTIHSQFQQSLFEQVWAADDYEIFKRMMMQKNIELQLQALEILARYHGVVTIGLVPDTNYIPSKEEEEIMETVIKKSLEEHKAHMDLAEKENLRKTLEATLIEKTRLENEQKREKEMLEKAMMMSIHEQNKPVTPASNTEEDNNPIVKPQEFEARQEYLRQQRDKLLELKRREREKRLSNYEKTTTQKRPKSSRAARSVVSQGNDVKNVDPQTLAYRKFLAARLKAEVIGNASSI